MAAKIIAMEEFPATFRCTDRHCFGPTRISALHVVAANMAALKKAASAVVPRATNVEKMWDT